MQPLEFDFLCLSPLSVSYNRLMLLMFEFCSTECNHFAKEILHLEISIVRDFYGNHSQWFVDTEVIFLLDVVMQLREKWKIPEQFNETNILIIFFILRLTYVTRKREQFNDLATVIDSSWWSMPSVTCNIFIITACVSILLFLLFNYFIHLIYSFIIANHWKVDGAM